MINLKNSIKRALVPKNKLIILNYHQVSPTFNPRIHNKYIWNSTDQFKSHIEFLKQMFELVSVIDGIRSLKNKTLKGTKVAITFDDGDASITEHVIPYLKKQQVPASFFINTAYFNEKAGYWYNLGPYLKDQKLIEASTKIRSTNSSQEYFDLLQLEHLANQKLYGVEVPFYAKFDDLKNEKNPLIHFGLHGHEHLRFSMLDHSQQYENLKKNITFMQDWPNYVPLFAIPFGKPTDWNETTIQVANELNVVPLLANEGYNTSYFGAVMRFSVDGKNLQTVFNGLSPFISKYKKFNQLNRVKAM